MFFEKKKQQAGGINRRVFPRINDRNLVKVSRCDGTPVEHISNIFDLSEGGVRLVCHEHFPLGTMLHLEINLVQCQKSVSANGKVVWIRPMKDEKNAFFAGVQFTNLSQADRELLKKAAEGGEI